MHVHACVHAHICVYACQIVSMAWIPSHTWAEQQQMDKLQRSQWRETAVQFCVRKTNVSQWSNCVLLNGIRNSFNKKGIILWMQEYANIFSLPHEGFSGPNYCHGETEEDSSVGDVHDRTLLLGKGRQRGGAVFFVGTLTGTLVSHTDFSKALYFSWRWDSESWCHLL